MKFDNSILSDNFDTFYLFNAYAQNKKDLDRSTTLISLLVQRLLSRK